MKRNIIITLILVAIVSAFAAVPAMAVETAELRAARDAYRNARSEAAQEQFLTELRQINDPALDQDGEFTWQVERWRPVVEMYFPSDLRIIECESHGDPEAKNPNSSASGLFQHLARLWPQRAAEAGFADADVFDPFANIAVAAWLLEHGGTSHWVCKAGK